MDFSLAMKSDNGDDADHMRQELSRYLDSMQHKTAEDGAPLLSYPKNFESIAAAMDRDDLVSEQEKPWSRYLLEQNMPSSEYEQDRYKNDEDEKGQEERKLQQGLAEIQMLDKQLKAASKKQLSRRQSSPTLSLDDAVFAREGELNTAPSTGRSSAASSRYGGGKTFLTRLQSEAYLGEDSRLNSARTDRTEDHMSTCTPRKSVPSAQGSPTIDLAESLLQDEEGDEMAVRSPDGMPRPPSHPSTAKSMAPPKKNFLEENRQTVQCRSRLNPEAQMRVSAILGFDDLELGEDENFSEVEKLADEKFEAQWKQISMYGYNNDEKKYIEQLDSKLSELRGQEFVEQHGGGPATSQSVIAITDGTTGADSKSKQGNYLIAQRAERTREAYTNQLDIAIRSMKRPMTAEMMVGLVSCVDDPSSGGAGGSAVVTHNSRGSRVRCSRRSSARESRELGKCRSVHDLPKVDDVSPTGMITMDEVLDVISELCHQDQQSGESDDKDSASHAHGQALAPRSEIDNLLKTLRPDIIQLSSLRHRQRDQESRHEIMSRTSEVENQASRFNSEVDYDDAEDRLHGYLEMESISHAPLGVEEVAANAAKFAQSSAAAASELSDKYRPARKKAKSSRIRKEIGAMNPSMLDPRKTHDQHVNKEFDISRNAVASEVESGSLRPTIRMRAENCGQISEEIHNVPRTSYDDGEEIIYSAPSSSQSSRRNTPQAEQRDQVSYYQSSRRQQAAREHSRSREGTVVAQDAPSKGFLPALPGASRPSSENVLAKPMDSAPGQSRMRNPSREPARKIGSKLNSAVMQPELSAKVDSPLKVVRTQPALDSSAAIDASAQPAAGLVRQPSREMYAVSTGLDDVHRKLSRLLARADRAQDYTEDEFSPGTNRPDSEIKTSKMVASETEFGETQLSGIMQNFLNDRSGECDIPEGAVASASSAPTAAEKESYVMI